MRGRSSDESVNAEVTAAAERFRRWTGTAMAPSSLVKFLLGCGVAVAVAVLAIAHRAAVDAGGASLVGADGEWLVLAVLTTVAMWIAGTVSLFGVMPVRPPVGRVFAVQIAASFANHLLPAGTGAMAVNVRFMRRYGVSRGAAMGAVGLNSLVTAVTHLALLACTVVLAPSVLYRVRDHVRRPGGQPITVSLSHSGLDAAVAVGLIGAVVLVVTLERPRRWLARRATSAVSALRRMAHETRNLKAVLRHPGRAAALWLSSLMLPVLHTLILFSVVRGLGARITVGTVLVIYLSMSALTALIPSPGAIGGLDVALVAGLITAGVPSTVAVGAVLGYRMITVWLPLMPSACMFAVLLHRRII